MLQHRVAEEGTGGTLEAHGALWVQVVGARRGPRGHQSQEQRAEPPGAPPRRRAAHPQPATALPVPREQGAERAGGGAAGSADGREAPGGGSCALGRKRAAVPGRGRKALRAQEASTGAAQSGRRPRSGRPRSLSARCERVRGRAALDCGEARPRGGRPWRRDGAAAPPAGREPATHLPAGDSLDRRQAPLAALPPPHRA